MHIAVQRLFQSKNSWFWMGLTILFCFFIYSWFVWDTQEIFNSPDENANYSFTKTFAETGSLNIDEPINQELGITLVHPRSTVVRGDHLVPESFLGLPILYGLVSRILGTWVILYITPLLASVAVVSYYWLLRNFFSHHISLCASALLLLFTPYWYYATRGMFHNVSYIAFLIIGLSILLHSFKSKKKHSFAYSLLAGLLIGCALWIRSNEILWITPLILGIFVWKRSELHWKHAALFVAGSLSVIGVMLYANFRVYGDPLSFGYTISSPEVSNEISESGLLRSVFHNVLPFGIHFGQIKSSALMYLLKYFPWFSSFAVLGFLYYMRGALVHAFTLHQKPFLNKLIVGYIVTWGALTMWLVLYYGSFKFVEFIDPSVPLVGSSYLRYWLPLFVFGFPIVIIGLTVASRLFKVKFISQLLFYGVIAFSIFSSGHLVLRDSLHALPVIRDTLQHGITLRSYIIENTESNSIIISGGYDRYLFPYRSVIYALPTTEPALIENINSIISKRPMYLVVLESDKNAKIAHQWLRDHGFKLTQLQSFPEQKQVIYHVVQ